MRTKTQVGHLDFAEDGSAPDSASSATIQIQTACFKGFIQIVAARQSP
jgi:hypothetical protein